MRIKLQKSEKVFAKHCMSYSQDMIELHDIYQELTRRYPSLTKQSRTRMIHATNNHLHTAFIKLKVFTGRAVTNSFAESVNSQLHRIWMNQQGTIVKQIKCLHEFTIQSLRQLDEPFVVTPELVQLLGNTTLSILKWYC